MNKLYRIYRKYSNKYTIADICWAKNEEDVYFKMGWKKTDTPKLIIEEIKKTNGCIFSTALLKGIND